MRRKNRRTKEQVKQEAEHLAESLGLTLEELYHTLVKDILLALQRDLQHIAISRMFNLALKMSYIMITTKKWLNLKRLSITAHF